jgi:hypothetical protein
MDTLPWFLGPLGPTQQRSDLGKPALLSLAQIASEERRHFGDGVGPGGGVAAGGRAMALRAGDWAAPGR